MSAADQLGWDRHEILCRLELILEDAIRYVIGKCTGIPPTDNDFDFGEDLKLFREWLEYDPMQFEATADLAESIIQTLTNMRNCIHHRLLAQINSGNNFQNFLTAAALMLGPSMLNYPSGLSDILVEIRALGYPTNPLPKLPSRRFGDQS
ncbi:MAG: hypothetical protein ACK518_02925 [bacterium]